MAKTIDLETGLTIVEQGIGKLVNIIEGKGPPFSHDEYLTVYTTIYTMCTQKPPHNYSQQLYDKYREIFENYITGSVLPAINEKDDEFMLRELVQRWSNHQIMVEWLLRFFHHLDRYFITRRSLTSLGDVGLICFRDLMSEETKGKIRDALIVLINQEREGEQIDRALLENVQDICVEIELAIV